MFDKIERMLECAWLLALLVTCGILGWILMTAKCLI